MDDRYMESIHDPECIELLEMYKRIRQGYHVLVEESTATEMQFLEFVRQQEEVRQKWSSAEKETHRLRSMVQGSATDKNKAEGQINNMRQQLQKEFDRRKDAEARVRELESVLDIFRDVLSGDRTMTQEDRERLYETAETLKRNYKAETPTWFNMRKSEDFDAGRISYDRSEDEQDEDAYGSTTRREYLKTKDGEFTETSRVTEKPDGDIEIIARTHVRIPENGPVEARSSLTTRPRRSVNFAEPLIQRRSQSVPRLIDESKEVRVRRSKEEADAVLSSDLTSQDSDMDSVNGCANLYSEPQRIRRRSKSLGRGLDARQHNFVAKTFLRTEKCSHCEKPIPFARSGVKCTECVKVCHSTCQGFLPIPCVPITESIGRKPNGHALDFNSFTTDKGLLVPAIIDQCINCIESHIKRTSEEGLYRIPGSQTEIQRLKREYVSTRSTVHMPPSTDIHVVCSLLKNFLMSLKEPLITQKLWNGFAAASTLSGNEETYRLINQLPPANRVTLSRIMLHLRKVADIPEIRMPSKNLTVSMAPSLIGNSRPGNLSNVELESEAIRQQLILAKLFVVDRKYWSDILSREHGPSLDDTVNTFHDVPADSFLAEGNPGGSSFTRMARSYFQGSSSKIDRSRPRKDNGRNFESPMMSD